MTRAILAAAVLSLMAAMTLLPTAAAETSPLKVCATDLRGMDNCAAVNHTGACLSYEDPSYYSANCVGPDGVCYVTNVPNSSWCSVGIRHGPNIGVCVTVPEIDSERCVYR